jgi:hypothetical protein
MNFSEWSHLIFQKAFQNISTKVFSHLRTNDEGWYWQLDFSSKLTICFDGFVYYLICMRKLKPSVSCIALSLYIWKLQCHEGLNILCIMFKPRTLFNNHTYPVTHGNIFLFTSVHKRDVWANGTSRTEPLVIEVTVPRRKSEQSCIYEC